MRLQTTVLLAITLALAASAVPLPSGRGTSEIVEIGGPPPRVSRTASSSSSSVPDAAKGKKKSMFGMFTKSDKKLKDLDKFPKQFEEKELAVALHNYAPRGDSERWYPVLFDRYHGPKASVSPRLTDEQAGDRADRIFKVLEDHFGAPSNAALDRIAKQAEKATAKIDKYKGRV